MVRTLMRFNPIKTIFYKNKADKGLISLAPQSLASQSLASQNLASCLSFFGFFGSFGSLGSFGSGLGLRIGSESGLDLGPAFSTPQMPVSLRDDLREPL
jgi:hypothetical protein